MLMTTRFPYLSQGVKNHQRNDETLAKSEAQCLVINRCHQMEDNWVSYIKRKMILDNKYIIVTGYPW